MNQETDWSESSLEELVYESRIIIVLWLLIEIEQITQYVRI
jgi:hypothetical protein